MGYKGGPILALHRPFNFTTGVVADYLHCVLLGVTKSMMDCGFRKLTKENLSSLETRFVIR